MRDPLTFIQYRNIFNDIVTGLDSANNLNKKLATVTETNAQLVAELNTFRPLLDQVNASFKIDIYADANVNITKTELLPWFAEYLYLYGPPNGVFDGTKLSYIVDRQIQSGLYTLDYYKNTPKYIID